MKKKGLRLSQCFVGGLFLMLAGIARGASLPNATQDLAKKAKVDSYFLADMEDELRVPREWLDKAKKEGTVRFLSGKRPTNIKSMFAPFAERYPGITVDFDVAGHEVRAIRTLVAYRSGKILADVLDSVGGNIRNFKALGSLEDLRTIPNVKQIPAQLKDQDGQWVATNIAYYCMAYNKKLVKPGDLPKKWEDLFSNPKWRGGKIAIGNRATLGPIHLWIGKGEEWTQRFFIRLFSEVKPVLRKESLNGLLELLSAGEFHAVIPAGLGTTYKIVERGAPLGIACPEPVFGNINEVVALRGRNINAAKVLINWLMSKEGQLSFYVYNLDIPIREDVRSRVMFPFHEEVTGKEVAFKSPGVEEDMAEVEVFWNDLWLKSGGKPR